jgi:hypothetical protein
LAKADTVIPMRIRNLALAPFEQREIGAPYLFRHACLMGLEGLVSALSGQGDVRNSSCYCDLRLVRTVMLSCVDRSSAQPASGSSSHEPAI